MRIVSLSLMSVMFWTGVAVAQTTPQDSGPVVPKGPAVESRERAVTRQLNTEVYVHDRAVEASNARIEADNAAAVRSTDRINAAVEADYQRDLAANAEARREIRAEAAADARADARAMAQWRADVAACEAGDHTRCAPTPH